MTYALTNGSVKALDLLLKTGGQETLLLARAANEIRCSLNVEADGDKLQAVIAIGPACHSIKLPQHDAANIQHLADFVEQIANGLVDTAEQPPTKPGVFDRMLEAKRLPASTDSAADMVNSPPHYTGHPSGVECIEVAEHLPFCLGNAFKYLFRRDQKAAPQQDIEKAIWYVERYTTGTPDFDWALPADVRDLLGSVAAHEPHPFGAAMLILGSPPQCGGYDACIHMLREEATRLSKGATPRKAA